MDQPTIRALYNYWDEVRGDRIAPRRFEIEPSRIASILPDTFILERLDNCELRYRLAGTRICDQFCADFRGANFLDGWVGDDRLSLLRKLRVVTSKGAVANYEMEAVGETGQTARFEVLLLPLLHAKPRVDRLLGAVAAIEPPHWIGRETLTPTRLTKFDLIWPEHAKGEAQPQPKVPPKALLPHFRHARVVRQNNRQFRVYEGGLSLDGREDS